MDAPGILEDILDRKLKTLGISDPKAFVYNILPDPQPIKALNKKELCARLQIAKTFTVILRDDGESQTIEVDFDKPSGEPCQGTFPEEKLPAFLRRCERWKEGHALGAEGLLNLGFVYAWFGDGEEALDAWNDGLRLRKSSAEVQEKLKENIAALTGKEPPLVTIPYDAISPDDRERLWTDLSASKGWSQSGRINVVG